MFFVEHRKGRSTVKCETSASPSVLAALASAKPRASAIGADKIVIKSRNGRVAGVFSTHSSDID
jgi:hypothetical protein